MQNSDLAALHLQRWKQGNILAADIERAEQWALTMAPAMLTVPGAWRVKVVNGSLWVKMLHMAPIWAERTNVLKLLLSVATTGPPLPDVDVVFVHSDQDPSPSFGWPCESWRQNKPCHGRQLPLLGNAVEDKLLKSTLPVPEFSWGGWKRQLPWCQLSEVFARSAARAPWASRHNQAYFAGSLDNGRWRRRLRALVVSHHAAGGSELAVKDVGSDFFSWGAKGRPKPNAAPAAPAAKDPIDAPCRYRYALSMPGHGYSNRLRALLACGCVVLHVMPPWQEFFSPALRSEVHWVVLKEVREILPTLARLRANETHARRIARAAQRYAMHTLRHEHVLDYFRELLTAVARRQPDPVTLTADFRRIETPNQLADVARLCDCDHEATHCPPRTVCCYGFNCPMTELGCPTDMAEQSGSRQPALPAASLASVPGSSESSTGRAGRRAGVPRKARGGGAFARHLRASARASARVSQSLLQDV